jgi:hypothetical protein
MKALLACSASFARCTCSSRLAILVDNEVSFVRIQRLHDDHFRMSARHKEKDKTLFPAAQEKIKRIRKIR